MKNLFISFILIFLITSCAISKFVSKESISKIIIKDAENWSIEECDKILNYYSCSNMEAPILNVNPKVKIKVLLLNINSVKAIARKEVIEKRLLENEYFQILSNYLNEFTNFSYDEKLKKIVENNSDSLKGFSFKMYFENMSSPFEPIFLEDGYSYFFLENMNGNFSRITNVKGLFVEEYFQLDGYLNAIITFSQFDQNGKRIFNSSDLNEDYKIVFNGFQSNPINISWKVL
ncbi:MAG: hypothetical protein IPM32_07940 [Ignavibacteriae bacterium]|nr:hypothetical protein [Ignavibacteriota bacterium]